MSHPDSGNTARKKSIFFFIIYLRLCWFFVSVRGFSPVVASGGHSSWWCAGLSLSRPLVAEHSSRRAGSVVVAHGLSCSVARGSSQTRARTRVPCIGRQTLNHCATGEAQKPIFVALSLGTRKLFLQGPGSLPFRSHWLVLNYMPTSKPVTNKVVKNHIGLYQFWGVVMG